MSIVDEAKELFGEMRDATSEERESIDDYIKSISTPTGVNIFDLMKDEEDCEYENTGLEPEEIAEAVRKWIPVAEGLPLGDESVLVQVNGTYKNVTYENAILTGAYFEDGGWIIDEKPEWEDPEIVAWMPLPEPYRSVRKSLNLPKKRSKN